MAADVASGILDFRVVPLSNPMEPISFEHLTRLGNPFK